MTSNEMRERMKHWGFSGECAQCLTQYVGTVISMPSSDYPHVVFCGLNRPLFLFPKSLYFYEHRTDMSKAQKAKSCKLLVSGEEIYFLANRNNIVVAFYKAAKISDKPVRYEGTKVKIRDYVVVSPSYPRECWSSWLMRCVQVGVSVDIMNAVPNIPYEAYLAFDSYMTPAPGNSYIPEPHLTIELGELVEPAVDPAIVDIVYRAEWNMPDRRGLFEGLTDWLGSDEVVRERRVVRPSLPKQVEYGVLLYIVDNRELVWPRKPYYRVIMGLLPSENERRSLVEGRSMRARLVYCRFNKFYVVCRYSIIKEGMADLEKYPPLRTRTCLGAEFGGHTEYFVLLTYSQYAGYYVCADFRRCLIDDPKLLLFHKSRSSTTTDVNFPAWVRLNEFGRPARFSVSSLPDDGRPAAVQRVPEMHTFDGEGFVANAFTGSVYCVDMPTARFCLQYADRPDVETGIYIRFHAVHVHDANVFLIVRWERVKTRFYMHDEIFTCHRGFLFLEQLDCTAVRACEHLYLGSRLGLVSDTEQLIRTKAQTENINMPSDALVYVVENEDRYRPAFFNVYAIYTPSMKEQQLMMDHAPLHLPSQLWWENIEEHKELESICADVYRLAADSSDEGSATEFSDELRSTLDRLRSVV